MKRIFAIVIGCLITSIGVIFLKHSHVVTGGTAGLSLNLSYLTHFSFGTWFFLINIPFYIFSFVRMGWKFTLSTILAVTLLSIMTSLDRFLPSFTILSFPGAIAGGILIGFGLAYLFLNKASLGGANILALFCQKKWGWDPGKMNFAFDVVVVLIGAYSVGLVSGLLSILSIAVTSYIISYFKHRIASSHDATVQTPPLQQSAS
ncbi:YitT family protein [Priestia koreensis]|uniref:YitT family protein n=1 Tax=Priestia koreensis TaxID=284581 RepID=UPI001F562033|nr:YitT family protein [Priestia koreensis]UNL86469.1 YitT family protein [Priestia koreensis]